MIKEILEFSEFFFMNTFFVFTPRWTVEIFGTDLPIFNLCPYEVYYYNILYCALSKSLKIRRNYVTFLGHDLILSDATTY